MFVYKYPSVRSITSQFHFLSRGLFHRARSHGVLCCRAVASPPSHRTGSMAPLGERQHRKSISITAPGKRSRSKRDGRYPLRTAKRTASRSRSACFNSAPQSFRNQREAETSQRNHFQTQSCRSIRSAREGGPKVPPSPLFKHVHNPLQVRKESTQPSAGGFLTTPGPKLPGGTPRRGGKEAAGAALERPSELPAAPPAPVAAAAGVAPPGPAARVQPGPPPAGCGDRGRAPRAAEPSYAPPCRPASARLDPGACAGAVAAGEAPRPRGRLRPAETRGSAAGPVARTPGTGAPLTVRLSPPLTRSAPARPGPAASWNSESPASRGVPAPSPRSRPATAPAALRSRRPARPGPAPRPPQRHRPAPPRRRRAAPRPPRPDGERGAAPGALRRSGLLSGGGDR